MASPAPLSTSCAPVPELQLSPDELQLLLETTTPTADDEDPMWGRRFATSGHTSGDDASSTTETSDPTQVKRARRTEIEKLSRRRRQETLREMREEVLQLEEQMTTLLRVGEDEKHQAERRDAVTKQQQGDLEAVRERFVQLSIEAQRLEAEKQDLRRMLRSRQLLQQSIKSLAAVFVDDWDDTTWHLMLERTYEPLPREEHFRIMREAYEAIVAFDERTDHVSSGNAFMGWVDRRRTHAAGVEFSFTKRFVGHDAERVMLDTWGLFSHEERFKKTLMRPTAQMRLRLLQQPNDDVMVLHRHIHVPRLDTTFQAVYLLFRLRTDDGYTICIRSIPAPSVQQTLGKKEKWVEEFHWVHFTHRPGGCEVSFGGSFEGELKLTTAEFLLGAFSMTVRWENVCIAPMFIMAAAAGDALS